MDTHRSPKSTTEFVRDMEQLALEALLRHGSLLDADEKLLGNLMEFLLSEQSAEEQALLERFYYQLLRCYRTSDEHLIKFVNQFVFCLIWRHFHDLIKSRQYGISIRPGLDALLIVMYNLMIVDTEGQQKLQGLTIPSLTNPSIYHDPAEFTVNILQGNAQGRGNADDEKRILIGKNPPLENLTRTKKWTVFRLLMKAAAEDLAYYSRACQKSSIIMGRLLIPSSEAGILRGDVELSVKKESRAFDKLNFKSFSMGKEKNRASQVTQSRVVLDEGFLLDLLDIYFILAYQGLYDESLGMVTDILEEGEHRMLPSVALLANSIKNRLEMCKQEPDELEEVPPIGASSNEDPQPTRKISAMSQSGSVREKRRKSFITRKESVATPRGDSSFETNDGDRFSRSDTPNLSLVDYGDGGLSRIVESSPGSVKSGFGNMLTKANSTETVV